MKIICQKCNKKGSYEKTTASFRDRPLEIKHDAYDMCREVVCDKCNYVGDSWFFNSKDTGVIGETL